MGKGGGRLGGGGAPRANVCRWIESGELLILRKRIILRTKVFYCELQIQYAGKIG